MISLSSYAANTSIRSFDMRLHCEAATNPIRFHEATVFAEHFGCACEQETSEPLAAEAPPSETDVVLAQILGQPIDNTGSASSYTNVLKIHCIGERVVCGACIQFRVLFFSNVCPNLCGAFESLFVSFFFWLCWWFLHASVCIDGRLHV